MDSEEKLVGASLVVMAVLIVMSFVGLPVFGYFILAGATEAPNWMVAAFIGIWVFAAALKVYGVGGRDR